MPQSVDPSLFSKELFNTSRTFKNWDWCSETQPERSCSFQPGAGSEWSGDSCRSDKSTTRCLCRPLHRRAHWSWGRRGGNPSFPWTSRCIPRPNTWSRNWGGCVCAHTCVRLLSWAASASVSRVPWLFISLCGCLLKLGEELWGAPCRRCSLQEMKQRQVQPERAVVSFPKGPSGVGTTPGTRKECHQTPGPLLVPGHWAKAWGCPGALKTVIGFPVSVNQV